MAANGEPASEGRDIEREPPTEQTPLIPSGEREASNNDQSQPQRETSASSLLRSIRLATSAKHLRWPSVVALFLLCVLAVLIMVFAFIMPNVVKEYASEAAVFEPTSLSVVAFTPAGLRARVQGTFRMNASRVRSASVRRLGRFGTWIAREAESGESQVSVMLPEYDNVVLGTAVVPGIKVNIQNGHGTAVDFLADLSPGNMDGARKIASDWIDGRLRDLRVTGEARIPLMSGLLSFGTQKIQHEIVFANSDIPAIPEYDVKKINFKEAETSTGKEMLAEVSIRVKNDYPVEFTIPTLAFAVLVDNCEKDDPYIRLADATTAPISIHAKEDIFVNVTGVVRELPPVLTQDCPFSEKSPLDRLLGKYIAGKETTFYVQGSRTPTPDTPRWLSDVMADITVPVPVPGHAFGDLIKNFTLTDTHFSLPDPWAEPEDPASNPRISAKVRALVALPEEMNFNVSVSRVRADADVFYKGKKLGQLDMHQWQPATSYRIDPTEFEKAALMVESVVDSAPIHITDEDLFADVIQDLIFKGKTVIMHIKAQVDVAANTALAELTVRQIPAEGQVPVTRMF